MQSQTEENQAASTRIAELDAELQETMARGREILVEGQDSIKKELVKRFPFEDFTWIDDIFPKEDEDEDEDGQNEERTIKDNPPDSASTIIAIDEHVIETWEEAIDDVPPAL